MPWLPALVWAAAACEPFFPKKYRATTTLEIRQAPSDPGQAILVFPTGSTFSSIRERINPLSVTLVGILVAYPVGYGLLIAGLVKGIRRNVPPPEAS